VAGTGPAALEDFVLTGGATEFSIPKIETYAVVDLKRGNAP
jgi:hypothetical protein